MAQDRKTGILNTISSFNTLLSNWPALLTVNHDNGEEGTSTTISFLLDISRLFGITDALLLDWVSRTLVDDGNNKTKQGILTAIEDAVKTAILVYLKSLYTCPVEPLLPDSFFRQIVPDANTPLDPIQNPDYNPSNNVARGVNVPLGSIDAFRMLRHSPTNKIGSVFYFDVSSDSVKNPNTVYRSTDMNAWLWYIINQTPNNWYNYAWDNRYQARNAFINPKENSGEGDEYRKKFVDTVAHSQLYEIPFSGNVGYNKKAIICAAYTEEGTTPFNSNVLNVYGASETYYRTGFGGRNKTVFEFNADYLYNLKLFDSKTIVARVIDALLGLSNDMFGMVSLDVNILRKKIEKTVEKVITQPITNGDTGAYFEFSEEEYSEIVNEATLRYNGKYATKNETNEEVTVDSSEIINSIRAIDSARTPDEKQEAVTDAIMSLGKETSNFSVGINTPFLNNQNIILKFLKEVIVQISLQMLSPKVMLLFAINNYFLENGNSENKVENLDFESFTKNFWNIINQCIVKIADLVMQYLFDWIMGFIRPVFLLIAKKLLLETLTYYYELLTNLLAKCSININLRGSNKNFIIDNVNYADIIPSKTTPE